MSADSPRVRLRLAAFVVIALFAAMLARLWYLQVLQAPTFEKAAVSNGVRVVSEQAPRGEILDRNGKPLVVNAVTEAVTLRRDVASAQPEVVDRLATVLGTTVKAIHADLDSSQFSEFKPVPVATDVSMDKVVYLREHQSLFPGVDVSLQTERSYPNGQLAAQVLGHMGPIDATQLKALQGKGYRPGDQIGVDGVEAADESWLRGTPGSQRLEVDASGKVIGTLSNTAPVPGHDVQLSIDSGLQQQVEADLDNQIHALQGSIDSATGQRIPAPDGAAVVLDPTNGQVLAMASYPTYDPSVWVNGISTQDYQRLKDAGSLLNRSIQGDYIPGSTFKLVTATAALDTGLINANDIIDDATGTYNCNGACTTTYHNDSNEALGPLDVSQAITASDDVFFYTLGYRFWTARSHYGETPIQDTAAQYGLGKLSGVDLPGEYTGRVDSPAVRRLLHQESPKGFPNSGWFAGDNIEMAFGQGGTVVTPLQLANAYGTFANGGTRYQPHVTAAVLDRSGKVVKTVAPVAAGHVSLPPSTRDPMLQGFEGVPVSGTAAATFAGFPLSSFPVAGKTGTASANGPNGQPLEPVSLFTAFAPANAPRYVVAVVIDQGGYGAAASAPVARDILQYLQGHPIGPLRAVK